MQNQNLDIELRLPFVWLAKNLRCSQMVYSDKKLNCPDDEICRASMGGNFRTVNYNRFNRRPGEICDIALHKEIFA